MKNIDPYPHVITPQGARASLVATVLTVLIIATALATHDHASARPAAAVHVATERTPSLAQLAKRPVVPRRTEDSQ
jgi:hypothetical protein